LTIIRLEQDATIEVCLVPFSDFIFAVELEKIYLARSAFALATFTPAFKDWPFELIERILNPVKSLMVGWET